MNIACFEEDDIHLLDHLCPLSYFLKIPLITSNALIEKVVNDFYPEVVVIKLNSANELLDYILKHIDVVIMTRQSSLFELNRILKAFSNKTIRYIYLPHGQSDKGFSDQYIDYLKGMDLSFCYGNLMEHQLKSREILQTLNGIIKTGNFRLAYFRVFKDFYKPVIQNILSPLKKEQTTILYTPTWNDLENLSSFEVMANNLSKHLPDHFNLIIKLHPFLEKENPIKTCLLTHLFSKNENALLLENCHTIYPLLDHIDVYLGDFSSIGYDALSFDLPLFFFNTSNHLKSFPLFKAGMTIPKSNDTFQFIEENLESNRSRMRTLRKKLYDQAFGNYSCNDLSAALSSL